MRFDFTERSTLWPAAVSVRPTRRRSPPTGARSTSPASSSRETNLDIPGTEIRSSAASSRMPIPGEQLDLDEQRDLAAGHAQRVNLAPELAVELQQHRPEPVGDGGGI